MKFKIYMKYINIFIIIFLFFSCSAKVKKDNYDNISFLALDTYCTIEVPTSKKNVLKKVKNIINKYDKQFNRYEKQNVISHFNKSNHTENKDLIKIFSYFNNLNPIIKKYYKLDMGNIIDLWDFKNGGNVPRAENLKEEMKKMKNKNLFMKNKKLYKKSNITVDVGGVLKGYILDVVSKYLDKKSINSYIINLGGDVCVKSGDESINVGIKNPDKNEVITYIKVGENKKNLL